MTDFILSEGDRIKIHGYVDVAGLEDGVIYKVSGTDKEGMNHVYILKRERDGRQFKVPVDHVEPYIDSKTYIEVFQNYLNRSGYITII